MSARCDVIDGDKASNLDYGLVYSEVLGWIDLGHAQGKDIKKLLDAMDQGERSQTESYAVTYAQTTYKFSKQRLGVGTHIRWQIKKAEPWSSAIVLLWR